MISKFKQFLSSKSIDYTSPSDGFVKFSIGELNYLFQYNESRDSGYFRLMLPNVDSIEDSNADAEDKRKKMIILSTTYKVGKCIQLNNQIWLIAESFFASKDGVEQVFDRMIGLLKEMIEKYRTNE